MGRVCDYCSTAKAVIFCRADSARLCSRMRQAGAPTPGTHSGKTIGLPTGRSEWGKNPRRRAEPGRAFPFDATL